jgi:branched-chain amino acid transport system permease protein
MSVDQLVLFALLGLGTGALIAGIAISLVLTYRGAGVINLAAGATAMVVGFAFWSLKNGNYGIHFATVPAMVITVVVAILYGVLTELVAFRPLRTATPLAKLVASLGILLISQALILLAFGGTPETEPSILPSSVVKIFTIAVPVAHFVLAGIVVVIAIGLTLLYRYSRFGLATRAAAENEASALLAGLSPNRLSMINTVMGCLIAGVIGVLAAPLISLDTDTLPLIVVPALAAALLARFTSIPIACLVGLAIGMGENVLYYLSVQSWFPTDNGVALPGVEELAVFLVILVAMFWRGAKLPGRGDILEIRLPAVPKPVRVLRPAIIALVIGTICLIVFPYDFRQALTTSAIGVVLSLSLVVLTGFVGQISVMQLALSGVAGLLVSHLAGDAGIAFPFGPILGALGATVLGLATAVGALRVRGVTLAVVTLAAAVAIEQFVFVNTTWGSGLAGAPVAQPTLFGINLGNAASFRGLDGELPSPILGIGILIVTILLCMLVANIRRGTLGQRMLAVRSNERAAAAVGISVRNTKLIAFGVSSFIAGIAGGLYGYNFGGVSADRFSALTALSVIAFAYIGGITMVSGALVAGFLATQGLSQYAFQKWFGISGDWTVLFAGVALVFNLVFYPEGIAGASYAKKMAKRRMAELGIQSNAPADRVKRMLLSRMPQTLGGPRPVTQSAEVLAPDANTEVSPLVVDK